MRILVQHIENLLPEHDCVVVPGLGGFVQNEVRSKTNYDKDLFYPATKEICFNPRLKFNDGLLAQSYQEIFGMSFEEANYQIQQSVQEIHKKLQEGKFVRIGRIGTLTNYDGQLIFNPDHKNHFLPESYGLYTFSFPKLHTAQVVAATQEAATGTAYTAAQDPSQLGKKAQDLNQHLSKKYRSIELDNAILLAKALEAHGMGLPSTPSRTTSRGRKITNRVMAGLAVFVLLIVIAKPAGKLSGNAQEANLMLHQYSAAEFQESSYPSVKPAISTSLLGAAAEALVRPYHSDIETNTLNIQSPESTLLDRLQETLSIGRKTKLLSNDNTFYVIVSTFSDRSTAETWLSLHANEPGVEGASIVNLNGWYRISTKSFKNKVEANRYLDEFKFTHPEYSSAWIYNH